MTTVVPMYLTELSPPKLTKLMGIFFPIGLTLGILIAQIMGLGFILGKKRKEKKNITCVQNDCYIIIPE